MSSIKATLIHDYLFSGTSCIDIVGGSYWNCKLFGGSFVYNGELIFNNPKAFVQFPKGILNSSSSISMEILVSTGSYNTGWCRILQFGLYAESNALSFAVDRVANNYNQNNHPENIMLEYFPRDYPKEDINEFQAYSIYKFNNQKNLHIVALLSYGTELTLYVNGSKSKSSTPIPKDEYNAGFADSYCYIGKSLDPNQLGFTGKVSGFRIWRGILSDEYINDTQLNANPTIIPTQRKGNPTTLWPSSFQPQFPFQEHPTYFPTRSVSRLPTRQPSSNPSNSQDHITATPTTSLSTGYRPSYIPTIKQPASRSPNMLISETPSFVPAIMPSAGPATTKPNASSQVPIFTTSKYPTLSTFFPTKKESSAIPIIQPAGAITTVSPMTMPTVSPSNDKASTPEPSKVINSSVTSKIFDDDFKIQTYRNVMIAIGSLIGVLLIAIVIYLLLVMRKRHRLQVLSNEWMERQFLRLGSVPDDGSEEISNLVDDTTSSSRNDTTLLGPSYQGKRKSVHIHNLEEARDFELTSMLHDRVAKTSARRQNMFESHASRTSSSR